MVDDLKEQFLRQGPVPALNQQIELIRLASGKVWTNPANGDN